MKGTRSATMSPKLSMRSQQSGDQKGYMPLKDSGVANTALSSAGMSSRVSRRVDVSPEHLQPLPDDVEVGPGSMSPVRGEIGTLMIGAKLTMSEYLTAWLAVFIFTLATVLSNMGNVLLSIFNTQISEDIGMTDAQYGMLTGYAYYLLLSVAMIVQGYVIDKYSLNRMYVVGFGGVLGAAGLLMQGFAKGFNMMFVGMITSAVGGSVFQILPIPILSDMLPPEQLSLGGAIATCGGYAAWLVGGNVADLCLKRGISWCWAVVGLSVGCGASSLAILAFLREPPVGRFIVKKEAKDRPQKADFSLKQVVLYMVSMSSMWILIIATGLRNIPEDWSGAYMPGFYSAEYPDQKTVFTAMSIIISIGGLSASFIYGAVCQRFYTKLPTISLYTTAIGAIIAAGCLAMSVTSHIIAGDDSNKGYVIAMTGLSLLVLFGEGWQGPLSVMVTLALPPEIKSFAVSLFFALSQLIGPSGTVLYGIYLTAGGWEKGTPEYITPARIYMLVCMGGGYISSAALYFAAIPAIKQDIAKREALVRAGGSPQITLPRWRKIAFIAGTAILSTAIAVLILISLIFSYDPNMIVHPHVHHLG